MKKYLVLILIVILHFNCSQKESTIEGVIIDPEIIKEVKKHIVHTTELSAFGDDLMQVYGNSSLVKIYENDSLIYKNDDITKKIPFKSFYLWDKETLGINGAYGLFGGVGFYIKIVNKKAELFHMLSADDFPEFAYNKNDKLISRLEVPCKNTKIILSEIPDPTNKQIIYGYIEFESQNYFASQGSVEGKEILPRKKVKSDMKIYFKSGFLNLDLKK